jgi:hypothetical protein
MAGGSNINWRISTDPSPTKIAEIYGDLSRRLVDWRGAFQQMVPLIVAGEKAIFASKGSAIGEPWSPVKEVYAKRKERAGLGRTDMHRTGVLQAFLTSPLGVIAMTKKRLVFGTDLPYARAVHFGQKRRIIGWTPDAVRETESIMGSQAQRLCNEAEARISAASAKKRGR